MTAVIVVIIILCILCMLVCYASLKIAGDYDEREEHMDYNRTCGNCRYAEKDCVNVDNPDCYCSNEDAEDFGYRVDVLDGCEEWEAKR